MPTDMDGDSAGYQGLLGHQLFEFQDGDLNEEEQRQVRAPYWGDEYRVGGWVGGVAVAGGGDTDGRGREEEDGRGRG